MVRTSMTAFVSVMALTACVQADNGQPLTFDGLTGSRTVNTDGNVSMNGASVSLEGQVGGWVEMNGASVDVDARIGGDLEANGASVEIYGQVNGASEINGGSVTLDGVFVGPIELNAARARVEGQFASQLTANAGGLTLAGDHAAPVEISGQGRDRTLFGRARQDTSWVEVEGHLAAGGRVCAHEVRFGRNATLGDVLHVEADEPPRLPEGVNPDQVVYTPRDGGTCRDV